jgi:hypothetical protein
VSSSFQRSFHLATSLRLNLGHEFEKSKENKNVLPESYHTVVHMSLSATELNIYQISIKYTHLFYNTLQLILQNNKLHVSMSASLSKAADTGALGTGRLHVLGI